MFILLDENIPDGVRDLLIGHDVRTTADMGWNGISNGRLLTAAEDAGFAVIVTADKSIRTQQNPMGRNISLVVVTTNNWATIRDNMDPLRKAVAEAGYGTYTIVQFPQPPKVRRPPPPHPASQRRASSSRPWYHPAEHRQEAGLDDDVLIAGGGPVGLCLALLLVEAGLSVTVVEPQPEIGEDLRASTFHPPTLDLLEPLGITQQLLAAGLPCPSWQIRLHPSGDRAVFDLGVLAGETGHPYRLQCEQWKLSRALRARLDGRAGFVAARLAGVSADDDGVTAELTLADGEPATRRARFLAGCDGAHSMTRNALGIAFDGATYPETTLLATTTFPFEVHLEGLSNVTYCWREGGRNFSLLKVPGRWRVSIYPREDAPIDDQMTPAALDRALQEIVPRDTPYEIGEARPYRVHMRLADRYVVGRVALAGDAAHVNSPAGGMGLNGGLHDAFCLAECLTAILRDGADPALLGRYERRRRPIARDEILGQADRNRARMREQDPARRRDLLQELQAITADPARMKAHLLRSSMIEGLRRAAAVL